MILLLKVVIFLVVSWFIAYFITMGIFYFNLVINKPDSYDEINSIKKVHLNMNIFVWIFIFGNLIFYFFIK